MTAPEHPRFERSRLAERVLRAYAWAGLIALPVQIWVLVVDWSPKFLGVALPVALALLQLLSMYTFGGWFKAAYSRLAILGVQSHYSPAMALAVLFVPFSNLFLPGQVIAELYEGSEPSRLRQSSRRRAPAARAATFWWYSFLAASIFGGFAIVVTLFPDDGRAPRFATVVLMSSQLLAAGAALGASHFVGDIRDRHGRCAILLRLDKRFAESVLLEDDGFRPSQNLAKAVRALLAASAVLHLMLLIVYFNAISGRGRGLLLPVALLVAAAGVASVVALLFWLRRGVGNVRRATPFPVSTSYAVAGFFIPVVNLVHPWWLLQSLWRWLDRINGGVRNDQDIETLSLADDNRPGSWLIDFWWFCGLAQVSLELFSFWKKAGGSLIVIVPRVALSLVAIRILHRIVGVLNRKIGSLERFVTTMRRVPGGAAASAASGTQRASWKDVLFPVASVVSDDAPEALRARELAEEARNLTRVRERIEARERARQRAVSESVYSSARAVTRVVRILLLLAIAVGVGESLALMLTYLSAISNMPVGLVFTRSLILITLGAAFCGLPAWLGLAYWAASQVRNANALGLLARDPALAATQILTLREPEVFRCLIDASSTPVSELSYRTWKVALRMLQAAPIWLAFGCEVGLGILSVMVFIPTLAICLSLKAMFVHQINSSLERVALSM